MSFKRLSVALAAYFADRIVSSGFGKPLYRTLRDEPIVVSGTLQKVRWEPIGRRDYGLDLYVDSHEYNIIRYSALSYAGRFNYGIEGDGMAEDVEILMRRLQRKLGEEIRLEYAPLTENTKLVLRLTIGGEEYIDEDEARRDHIRHDEVGRNMAIIQCVITLIIWVIVFIRKSRKQKKGGRSS